MEVNKFFFYVGKCKFCVKLENDIYLKNKWLRIDCIVLEINVVNIIIELIDVWRKYFDGFFLISSYRIGNKIINCV